jgi:Gnt-I system high-affinity gluconate transporter
MIPLIFSVVYQYKLPAVYIGLPMLHLCRWHMVSYLSPLACCFGSAVSCRYGANFTVRNHYCDSNNYCWPLYSNPKNISSSPNLSFATTSEPNQILPSTFLSFFTALFPVFMMAGTTILTSILPSDSPLIPVCKLIGDPAMVMLLAVLVATATLGGLTSQALSKTMNTYSEAVKDVAMVLLIIAGAGALKQVFMESGVSDTMASLLKNVSIHPLILGWLISAFIRVCLGSATVAGLTTAGIMAPMIETLQVTLT